MKKMTVMKLAALLALGLTVPVMASLPAHAQGGPQAQPAWSAPNTSGASDERKREEERKHEEEAQQQLPPGQDAHPQGAGERPNDHRPRPHGEGEAPSERK